MNDLIVIQNYVQSNEQYPVPFDEFWQWVGYSRKDVAKRKLEANFKQGTDYELLRKKVEQVSGAKWVEDISLTTDCAKSFAMLAQTQKGREIRDYFIDCEKQLKKLLKPLTPAQMILQQAQQLVEHEEELRAIQESREEATKYLEQVAKEPTQALQVSIRKAFDALVKAYAEKTGADVPLIFNTVYKEFSLRYRKDVFTLAKRTKQSVIAYIESIGYMTELYAVAKEVLK